MNKKVKGLTLIELLTTLAIASILISLASSSFANIIADNKLTVQHNNLISAIALTRSESIKRAQRVTLCQSSNNNSCTKVSSDWHQGWVVFTDINEDNQIDANEPILLVQQAISDLTISYGARTRIAFHPNGSAVGGSNGTFLLCDFRGDNAKKGLILSNTGRARKATTADLKKKRCV